MTNKGTVVVGLSGGVDSSFAAAILKDQGYEVIGIMLKLWSPPEQEELNRCCSIDSMVLARRVAAKLDIPFYVIDARDQFRSTVVEYFIRGYGAGITPNPCLMCNAEVRWRVLMDQADRLGAEMIATGHYATIQSDDGIPRLIRGVDEHKDQSYVLSRLPRGYLARTILPVGMFQKPDVRERCKTYGLPTASRPDSQDLCFLGDMDYRQFLNKYTAVQEQPGEIIDRNGVVLGQHNGLHEFTIGQRKGLRIAYKYPLYVLQKDYAANRLVVGIKQDLERSDLVINDFNWLIDPSDSLSNELTVKVRYSTQAVAAQITLQENHQLAVHLLKPVTEVSPGQVAALYDGNICIGGGIII